LLVGIEALQRGVFGIGVSCIWSGIVRGVLDMNMDESEGALRSCAVQYLDKVILSHTAIANDLGAACISPTPALLSK
jgi:hypothetical protein